MGLSQTTIDGTAILGWGSVKHTLLSIVESFPYVPYVGWDLAVVDEGESEILEMNVNMTSIPSRSIARSYGTSGPSGSIATTT